MTASTERGNCFTVAAGFAVTALPRTMCARAGIPYRKDERGPFRIVHGTPVGTSGEILGLRHWHAWVEVDTPAGWVVLDYSNGKEVSMPRILYYAIGQLGEEHVWRFTLAEAEQYRRRLRHCGPWVDDWQTIADGDA